ncbi:Transcriptional regulator, LysR family [Cronobacter condimenti 1330]|uniref:Transcriptional regulator, LysR family n=1 Tax=Cronobacter condimenti 1330 TaxID=1073999 RepID=K8AD43_9ENTR|nr:Transcriptional regulator, LysR family [Cronobacter condimenti 1330]
MDTQRQIQVSDDILGVISLATRGAGICQTYDFIARPLMASGLLREILPHTRGRTRPFSLIYAPHKGLSSASEALIRFMQQVTD